MPFELVTAPDNVIKIKVIGVGGGGSNVEIGRAHV